MDKKISQTDLRTAVAALTLIIVGILFLILGSQYKSGWQHALLTNVGSFVIASVVLALIWEYWQMRNFMDDLFRRAGIVEQLRQAKLSGFFTSFQDNIPWNELFANCNRLDILFAYGATWRNSHQDQLERFLSNPDAELEVVLPDPENREVLQDMAARFSLAPEVLDQRIRDAAAYFESLGRRLKGRVVIYYLGRALTFTFYRFNTKAVFTTYRHTTGKGPVVTFVCDRGGDFYEWIRQEWHGIVKDGVKEGVTRVVSDSKQ